jgi:HK97 family phage major capsid protein
MSLQTLRGELETLKARAQAIIDQYGAGGLTAEKNVELTNLTTKCAELAGQIKAERDLEEKKRDLGALDEFLNAPQYKVPHGIANGGDDAHKALRAAGWEIKGGIVMAPTSVGKMVEMFPEAVLFGDLPVDDEAQLKYFKSTRRAMQPDYRPAYEKWMRNLAKHRTEAMAYTMLSGEEQKALSEGTDTAGGFLVPPDVQAELLVRVAQKAVMRKYARIQTTSRDILKYPMVQANATSGSIYSSGFVGGWAGETPAFSDTDAAFGSFDLPIKKLRVATRLSNDFVSDAVVNILAFLAQNGAENMALVEDSGFINGDGTALQPRGILNTPGISSTDVTGTTAHTISNTAALPVTSPNALIDLVYSLPPQYTSGATWLMRRSVEGHIRKLVDGQGRYQWPTLDVGGFGNVPKSLMGYGLDNSDFVPADGTAAATVAIFGDLSGYVIAQRAQVTSTVLRERFADVDQLGIILWERVGGGVWNVDSMRLATVS